MTGKEFREARLQLGLSFRAMARALHMGGDAGRRDVRRFEVMGPPAEIVERARLLLDERDRGGEGDDEAT